MITVCDLCADFVRTAGMLDDLAAYADTADADRLFVDVTAYALAMSLPLINPPAAAGCPNDTNPDH